MMRASFAIVSAAALLSAGTANARELATIERVDDSAVQLVRDAGDPVSVWLSEDTLLDASDREVAERFDKGKLSLEVPSDKRMYVILQSSTGESTVVAERRLPLEKGSNFRDIGGYVTKDGKQVLWGKAFRSGAMPMLTEADYALISGLDLDSVVDLRSLEERALVDDKIDDRTGALFLSNDYSMKALFAKLQKGDGENMYKGMEQLLAPQLRSLYRRIMADEGAVLYHCSAGQDRTGIATAVLYDVLGVDRETILKDYHLSTQWRRPEWEMPEVDPKDYPDNPLVQYYASMPEDKRYKAQPLYTPSGASHLAQFFTYLDANYGGSVGYMTKELGFSQEEIGKLRKVMLTD